MYRVLYTKPARKALKAMPRNTAEIIVKKIDLLAIDPYAANPNVKALRDGAGHRLRAGDWRVLYELDDDTRTVHVLAVRPRGGAYP